MAEKFPEELNQLNEKCDTKKGRLSTHKSKIRKVFKEKMEKQSNGWPIY